MSSPTDSPELWSHLVRRFLGADVEIWTLHPAAGGFSDATVVQIETTSGQYALRCWPVGHWPLSRTLERHRWLRHLAAAGIPVAVPMPACDTLETVLSQQDCEWQLEPWLPGESARPSEMNPARWQSLMGTLAHLHLASSQYISTPSGATWFQSGQGHSPAVSERRQIIANWTPTKLVQVRDQLASAPEEFRILGESVLLAFLQHAERIDRELYQCEEFIVSLHPCFRDLWREHVLFSGDEVTGLIDPTAARTEHIASDLSRLLGSFCGDDLSAWNAALTVYETVRPLTPTDHQLLRVFDRSSVLLSGMTWIQRWKEGSLPEHQLAVVIERMKILSGRLKSL